MRASTFPLQITGVAPCRKLYHFANSCSSTNQASPTSYQLVNASSGGPSYTFSSIADQDWFSSGTAPVPLLVADSRAPGELIPTADGTIYTFSPWELGSDDPTVYAFAPLKYVGTNFTAGTPATKNCVTGFDNVGFVSICKFNSTSSY